MIVSYRTLIVVVVVVVFYRCNFSLSCISFLSFLSFLYDFKLLLFYYLPLYHIWFFLFLSLSISFSLFSILLLLWLLYFLYYYRLQLCYIIIIIVASRRWFFSLSLSPYLVVILFQCITICWDFFLLCLK